MEKDKKKTSVALMVLGWGEILFSGIGFLLTAFYCLVLLAYAAQESSIKSWEVGTFMLLVLIPLLCLLLFIIGIGILKVRVWAWRLNVFLHPCIYIYIVSFFAWYAKQWRCIFDCNIEKIFFVSWLVILTGTIFYLTRPEVKALFFDENDDRR